METRDNKLQRFRRFDINKVFTGINGFNTKPKKKHRDYLEKEFEATIENIDVHYHPDVFEMEDVLEMVEYGKEKLDRIIMRSIMENLELQMLRDLKSNEVCVFPYIGRGKINKAIVDVKRARKNYSNLKREFDRDEYKEITGTILRHSFDVNDEYERERAGSSYVRKKYREEIDQMRLLYGENYVDLFVYSMTNFSPANVDKEGQYEFDVVNNIINEDGSYNF